MSSNIPHPLETLKYVEKQLVSRGDAHLIQTLLQIERKFCSPCNPVVVDEYQSRLYHLLDTLQWVEERCGSFRGFSDEIHLLETLNRFEDQWGSFDYDMFSEEHYILITTLPRLAEASRSFNVFLEGYHFSEESRPLDTLQWIEEKWGSINLFSAKYLSMLSHLRGTLHRIEDECESLYTFLVEYLFARELDTLTILLRIEEDWGSFRIYFDEFRSKESDFLETLREIREECDSFIIFLAANLLSSEDSQQLMEDEWSSFDFFSEEHMSSLDRLRFLKRDFKFLSVIIELHIFKDEPYFSWENVRALFHGAADRLIQMYTMQVSPWSRQFYDYICHLQYEFQQTKMEILKGNFSFQEISCQLLANEDGIVIPSLVMKFIDIVADNLSNLLKFDDLSSPLCIGGRRHMVQMKKVLKELNFLNSFLCFVADRCIEPQVKYALFTHVVQVAWQATVATWLCLPSNEYMYQDTASHEENPLLSDLLHSKIQPIQPNICKFYIHILQALNLVQSRWYPIINVKYVFDGGVLFLESLLQTLKELPTSTNCIAIKEELTETLQFFVAILVNLPTLVLEFHLQDIDSGIVDAGLLVFSLNDDNENVDFAGKIRGMQGVIYLVARKKFLLQFNLPGIVGVDSADFILDNREKFLSMYSNSFDSVKSQLPTIQKELKCFQAVVEQQDGLQHFAAKTTCLVYEVEHIVEACKKKDVPDWCLFIWILNIGEDVRMLMAEVAEIAEIHYETTLPPYKPTSLMQLFLKGLSRIFGVVSSQFSSERRINEEIVGFEDVKNELIGKLRGGPSGLDVISIVGMAGLGKTTLANKLYSDESVFSYFDIHAHCCVSQEYTRKDLLLALLRDITDETAKLGRETENELADKLRKLLLRRRYLLLIDDVWETSAWDDLKLCFPNDDNRSRIIMTTRHYEVASHAKHYSHPHKLRFLNDDESWMLLNNKVFNNESCPLILRDVGEKIVTKCGGHPLSIILVAGILTRMKKEKHCWEQVATNLGSNIQDQMEGTLDLSYKNLPPYLKPCFLYLGVFPEDGEIQLSKLTCLWIAEGFIKPHTGKILEETAESYLENLSRRNLVIVDKRSFDGRIKTCHVHDLVLEFCRKKAKLENILQRINGDAGSDPSKFFPPKCNTSRRLSLHSQCDNLEKWFLCFTHVKSFRFREPRGIAFSSIGCASDILKRFKFLRVLDFEFTVIDSFPQELTLLRYVAFQTNNDTLSLSTNLWDLETLIVQGTRGRISLPDTIWKMVKLRHLQINNQTFFTLQNEGEFLKSSSKMYDLQTLSSAYFSCGENADKILTKTPNLRRLRCEVSAFDGSFTAFNNLTMLETLEISSGATLTSVDQLKLPSHLKKLALSKLHINLNEVATLSNLKVLKLIGVTFSSDTWKVNDEQFGELKFLELENASISEWDVSDDAFPRLEHLVLRRCRYLEAIPTCFGGMPSLKSIEVKSCKESLADSAMVIKEMQLEVSGISDFSIHR